MCAKREASHGAAFSKPRFIQCLIECGIFQTTRRKQFEGVRCEQTRRGNCKNTAQNKSVNSSQSALFQKHVCFMLLSTQMIPLGSDAEQQNEAKLMGNNWVFAPGG